MTGKGAPRRSHRIALAAAALACAAGGAWADPIAEIASLRGKGEHRPERALAWNAARLNQPLDAADHLRTVGRLSRMDIFYRRERVTETVDGDAEIQVTGTRDAKGNKCDMTQLRGRSFGSARTPPEGFNVCSPSGTAAVRGTEWEFAVDRDGASTLSVLHGQVEFYNEHGSVMVAANEQARAEVGKAPVKLALRITRERVQWVTSFAVDTGRYREFRDRPSPELAAIATQLREQRITEAYEATQRLAGRSDAPAAAILLLADFEIYRGDLAAAERVAARGAARFPRDERFAVSRSRIALYAGDIGTAYAQADAALAIDPRSSDALVMKGDIERHEGRAAEAMALYARAIESSAGDARAWYGRGVVASEREDVRRARVDLAKAIELDATEPAYRAELGTLEGVAANLGPARIELDRALKMQPDNYVALTGLGIVQLKAGDLDNAIASFQKATAIEPRYARAHLYAAAAFYQKRLDRDAITELQRAAELDPNDPLPHLLLGMIHLDRIEPGDAAAEARAALTRMPFLKSLNAVADNQKGVANLGAPLAFMGLEEWARSTAHDSYLPFWGGSHLFLSDRYPGEFDRRSELMQGFVTDPIVFGASNRFQTLFPDPGLHATASLTYSHSDDLRVVEPIITVNGYDAAPFPIAYLAEAIDTRVDPGNSALMLRGKTYTAAIGAKPTHELGVFLYTNRLDIDDAQIGTLGVPGVYQRITGKVDRVDAGVRYAPSSAASFWLKAGGSKQSSVLDETDRISGMPEDVVRASHFTLDPKASDIAFRHGMYLRDGVEVDWGAEAARVTQPSFLGRDRFFHFVGVATDGESLTQDARDRSAGVYAMTRIDNGPARFEAGLGWRKYEKDRGIDFVIATGPGHIDESLHRDKVEPFVGVTWRLAPASVARLACRRWLRPASLETMAPVAVAAMPLDDQLVYAGGLLDQCRAQWEWTPGERTFFAARVERSKVDNLYSPLDGVQNTQADISNLERLRNRVLTPPPQPDLLEDNPVFASGVARRANLAIEQIVTSRIALRAYYTYTESENDGPAFPDRKIPFLARHQANVGGTWAPGGRAFLTVQAIYRSQRFSDEQNLVPLPAGWDAQARLFIESDDKRWALEAFAANLLKKQASDVFGVTVSYRY